jgi:hypothetical protein
MIFRLQLLWQRFRNLFPSARDDKHEKTTRLSASDPVGREAGKQEKPDGLSEQSPAKNEKTEGGKSEKR